MSEWLQQPHRNQDGDIVVAEAEEPSGLVDVESRRRDGQVQEIFLLLLHKVPMIENPWTRSKTSEKSRREPIC